MEENKKAKEILERLRKYISERDVLYTSPAEVSDEKLMEYLLTGMDANKDIQTGLYSMSYKSGGVVRKIKNKIIEKVGNISRNVVEVSITKQQKYNEAVGGILSYLIKQNEVLKKEIEELKRAK